MRELEKLALFAGAGATVDAETVDLLSASAVETQTYELGDAVFEGDRERSLELAEKLLAQDVDMMVILFALRRKLRDAHRAWAMTSSGASVAEVQSALGIHPYGAKLLVSKSEEPRRPAFRAGPRCSCGAGLVDQGRDRARSGELTDADARRRGKRREGLAKSPRPLAAPSGARRATSCGRRCWHEGRRTRRPCRSWTPGPGTPSRPRSGRSTPRRARGGGNRS